APLQPRTVRRAKSQGTDASITEEGRGQRIDALPRQVGPELGRAIPGHRRSSRCDLSPGNHIGASASQNVECVKLEEILHMNSARVE
ncbi:hypothetical protein B296_00014894, partial [Ensete ventricosum]